MYKGGLFYVRLYQFLSMQYCEEWICATYWAVIVPLSFFVILGNIVILLVWYHDAYKFSRHIWLAMELTGICYQITYHVFTHVRDENNAVPVSDFFFITVRLIYVTFYVLLAAMQFYWTRHLHRLSIKLPNVFTRQRINCFLISLCIACILIRFLFQVMRNNVGKFENVVISSINLMLTLVIPQLVTLVFIAGIIRNLRLQRFFHAHLSQNMPSRSDEDSSDEATSYQSSLELNYQLSYFEPSDISFSVSSTTSLINSFYLKMYEIEKDFSIAIIIICIPPIFIISIGFTVAVYFRLRMLSLTEYFFNVMDILQILSASCHAVVLWLFVPSFRNACTKQLKKFRFYQNIVKPDLPQDNAHLRSCIKVNDDSYSQ